MRRSATTEQVVRVGLLRWELVGLPLVALLGIALRLRQYFFNRPLWLDESFLAENVVDRDLITLLSKPLTTNQSAPPGFLVIARSLADSIGPYDWTLRLVPLFSGLLIIVLAIALARREFTSPVARLTFVGLLALSPVLIYYSSEFKQYSSDALAALAIFVALSFRSSPRGTWLLASVGFVALVFSLPAFFVVAAAGLLLLYEALRSHRYEQVLIVGLVWLAGAALHGLYILHAGPDREFMLTWWSGYHTFAPFPPGTSEELLWYPRAFSGLTHLAFRNLGIAAPPRNSGLSDPLGWALALTFALSLVLALYSSRKLCIVAAASMLLALIASGFEIYPFSTRVLIFLVPLVLFIFSAAIDNLKILVGSALATVCALLLISVMIPIALKVARKPVLNSDMPGALRTVSREFHPGDALAVEDWSWPAFRLYKSLAPAGLTVFKVPRANPFLPLLERVRGNGYQRVWFVTSHKGEEDWFSKARQFAPISFAWKNPGTRLMRFDFTPKSP